VNEKAIYEALVSGKVAGYATDVFEVEPPAGSPLLDLPNVIVSPHMGTHTRESLALMGRRAADAVLCVLQGKPPEFAMNPEVWNHRKEG
jgi:D-3-phosphoglycerate dehydrogenase